MESDLFQKLADKSIKKEQLFKKVIQNDELIPERWTSARKNQDNSIRTWIFLSVFWKVNIGSLPGTQSL